MSFDTFFLVCSTNDRSLGDAGVKVSIQEAANEWVLFFDLSNQANANSAIRTEWGMNNNELLCDGIVFYSRKPIDRQQPAKILCFLELKGTDVKHAAEQVINTHKFVKTVLANTLNGRKRSSFLQGIKCTAYIYQHSSSPANTKDVENAKNDLDRAFGKGNHDIKKNNDLGSFLRKL